MVLWDTGTNRGWLINGLRALLHTLRQSFRIDENEDLSDMFILKSEDLTESKQSYGPRAAREFLSNARNMSAKVSISTVRCAEYIYETLSERFERIYDVVEQAFDYQSKRRDWNQIPRSHLEGWEFLSLARKDDTIPSSIVLLPAVGKVWIDSIRATGTITLIGDGFGNILQPQTATCETVPIDRFCLAVSVSDLEVLISPVRRGESTKPTLLCRSPSIIWHSPSGSSDNCNCVDAHESKHERQPYMQVMWPAAQRNLLPAEDETSTLEARSNGAVVFGHDNSLEYYIPNFGQIPQPGHPPQAIEELKFVDSGVGSSLDSVSGRGKAPAQSAISLSDKSQSTLGFPNSRSNSYGDSAMSGGCGVFGNVGNFSVNQYFGYMLGGDTYRKSMSRAPLLLHDSRSFPQQFRDDDSSLSVPSQTVPRPGLQQEE